MQQSIDVTYDNMKKMYLHGLSSEEIIDYAVDNGHTIDEAKEILESIQQIQADDSFSYQNDRSKTSIIIGALFLVAGIFFSFIVSTGFIFYGAIAVGAIIIIKRLV